MDDSGTANTKAQANTAQAHTAKHSRSSAAQQPATAAAAAAGAPLPAEPQPADNDTHTTNSGSSYDSTTPMKTNTPTPLRTEDKAAASSAASALAGSSSSAAAAAASSAAAAPRAAGPILLSLHRISIVIALLQSVCACLVLLFVGYYSPRFLHTSFSRQLQTEMIARVAQDLQAQLAAPLRSVMLLERALANSWPDLGNTTMISERDGWPADLSAIMHAEPSLWVLGYVTRRGCCGFVMRQENSECGYADASTDYALAMFAQPRNHRLADVQPAGDLMRFLELEPVFTRNMSARQIKSKMGEPTLVHKDYVATQRPYWLRAQETHPAASWVTAFKSMPLGRDVHEMQQKRVSITAVKASLDRSTVVLAGVDYDGIRRLLSSLPIGEHGLAIVINAEANVVASSNDLDPELLEALLPELRQMGQLIQATPADSPLVLGRSTLAFEGMELQLDVRRVSIPQLGWWICLATNPGDFEKHHTSIARNAGLFGFAVLYLGIFASFYLVRLFGAPLQQLVTFMSFVSKRIGQEQMDMLAQESGGAVAAVTAAAAAVGKTRLASTTTSGDAEAASISPLVAAGVSTGGPSSAPDRAPSTSASSSAGVMPPMENFAELTALWDDMIAKRSPGKATRLLQGGGGTESPGSGSGARPKSTNTSGTRPAPLPSLTASSSTAEILAHHQARSKVSTPYGAASASKSGPVTISASPISPPNPSPNTPATSPSPLPSFPEVAPSSSPPPNSSSGGSSSSASSLLSSAAMLWQKLFDPLVALLPGAAGLDKLVRMSEINQLEETFSSMLHRIAYSHAQLVAVNHAKRHFIRYIFHEVRVPFNAVVLAISELQQLVDRTFGAPAHAGAEGGSRNNVVPARAPDPNALAQTREILSILSEQSEVVVRILNDVLSLQRIEEGALRLEVAPFDFESMLRSTVKSFSSATTEKKLQVVMDIQDLGTFMTNLRATKEGTAAAAATTEEEEPAAAARPISDAVAARLRLLHSTESGNSSKSGTSGTSPASSTTPGSDAIPPPLTVPSEPAVSPSSDTSPSSECSPSHAARSIALASGAASQHAAFSASGRNSSTGMRVGNSPANTPTLRHRVLMKKSNQAAALAAQHTHHHQQQHPHAASMHISSALRPDALTPAAGFSRGSSGASLHSAGGYEELESNSPISHNSPLMGPYVGERSAAAAASGLLASSASPGTILRQLTRPGQGISSAHSMHAPLLHARRYSNSSLGSPTDTDGGGVSDTASDAGGASAAPHSASTLTGWSPVPVQKRRVQTLVSPFTSPGPTPPSIFGPNSQWRPGREQPMPQPLCLGDMYRLRQTIANFVSNAIKFTKEGGKIVIRLTFTLAEPHNVASLSADARAAAAKAVAEAKQAAAIAALNASPLSSPAEEIAGSKPLAAASTAAPDASPSTSAAGSAAAAPAAPSAASDGSDLPTVLFHLSVIDDGIGVSLEEQAKLFQPFVQLSAGTSQQKGKGSGLGLSISRNLILLHGGSIGYRAPKVTDVLPFSPSTNEDDLHSTGSPVEQQHSAGASVGSSAALSRSVSEASSSAETTPSSLSTPSSSSSPKRASEFWMTVPMQVLPMPPRPAPTLLPPALVAHHTKHRSFDSRSGADHPVDSGGKSIPARTDIHRSLHAGSGSGSGSNTNSRSSPCPTTPPSPVSAGRSFLEDTRAAAEFHHATSMLDGATSVLYNPSPATTETRTLADHPPIHTATSTAVTPSMASRSNLSHSQSMQIGSSASGTSTPAPGTSAAVLSANAQLQAAATVADSLQSANRPPRSPFSMVRRLPLVTGQASARESTSFARSTDGNRSFDANPSTSPLSSGPASSPQPLAQLSSPSSLSVSAPLPFLSPLSPAAIEPASASSPSSAPVPAMLTSPPSQPVAPPLSRILVVEDSLPNLKLLCMMVRSLRYHVEGVEHGGLCVQRFEEALAAGDAGCAGPSADGTRAHGWPFDVVLLDGSMPVLNGPQTARRLRAMGVQVPIIACTGNALADDVDEFLQAGANCVLTKPVDKKKLSELLAAFLRPADSA